MKLGNNVKRLRFEAETMSQESLAERIGVTRQTIISIEKGRFVPSTLLALRLAATFDTQVEDVFFLKEEESPVTERR